MLDTDWLSVCNYVMMRLSLSEESVLLFKFPPMHAYLTMNNHTFIATITIQGAFFSPVLQDTELDNKVCLTQNSKQNDKSSRLYLLWRRNYHHG